jgi:spore photoproduct lyase
MSVNFLKPNFSHIYLEKGAEEYPLTKIALKKFPNSKIIKIDHYKDFFNRPNQDFQVQKLSMNLILAKKLSPFLYPASEMVQEFGTPNVFYNTPILNCLYNCDYCFLQGMYSSGNMVVFVNESDFMDAIEKKISSLNIMANPMIVAISYNTDIMAMENILPLASRWIEFAKRISGLIIEIRTKSALFSSIKNIKPSKNIILSWTLSPEVICANYESNSPPFLRRLNSAKSAVEKGWLDRFCFDPIILFDGWFDVYESFFKLIFQEIDNKKIRDVTVGLFRMNKDFFKRIKKREPNSPIYYGDYVIKKGVVYIDEKNYDESLNEIKGLLLQYLPESKILIWD